MPSNVSHTRRRSYAAGISISVRYQYDVRHKLSGMMFGRLFSPYSGSGYTPLSTSVVSTVPGTVARYHARDEGAGACVQADECNGRAPPLLPGSVAGFALAVAGATYERGT